MTEKILTAIGIAILAFGIVVSFMNQAAAGRISNKDLQGTWFVSGACAGAVDDAGDPVTCAFTCRFRIGGNNRETGNPRRCQMTIRKAGASPVYLAKAVTSARFKLRDTKTAKKYASYSLRFCTDDGVCFQEFGGAQMAYPRESYKNGSGGPWFSSGGAFEMFFPNGSSCAGHWTIQFSSGAMGGNAQ